jgi:hypothetical protein
VDEAKLGRMAQGKGKISNHKLYYTKMKTKDGYQITETAEDIAVLGNALRTDEYMLNAKDAWRPVQEFGKPYKGNVFAIRRRIVVDDAIQAKLTEAIKKNKSYEDAFALVHTHLDAIEKAFKTCEGLEPDKSDEKLFWKEQLKAFNKYAPLIVKVLG